MKIANLDIKKKTLPNGLKVELIKTKSKDRHVSFIIPIGNNSINMLINKKVVKSGTAHFLEHKLFDLKDGDAIELFDDLGISYNAETSFDYTSYFVSSPDENNLLEGIKILVRMLNEVTFDDASVEKERKIIDQEHNEELDSPRFITYKKVMQNLFSVSPFKEDLVGEHEDIMSISKENLYDFFNAFYSPSNMTMLMIGDFSSDLYKKAYEIALTLKSHKSEVEILNKSETQEINEKKSIVKRKISVPIWAIGYKFIKEDVDSLALDASTFSTLMSICLNALFSRASDFKDFLRNHGFSPETALEADYGSLGNDHYVYISGSDKSYEKIRALLDEYYHFAIDKIDEQTLEMYQRNNYGRILSDLNSNDVIYMRYVTYVSEDKMFYEHFKDYENITLEHVKKFINMLINKKSTFVVTK